jgi:hypothetical protein
MAPYKKIVFFLALFSALAAQSFGESFYTVTFGPYRFSESYFSEDVARVQTGVDSLFTLYYFSEKFFLGLFARTALKTFESGQEWSGNTIETLGSRTIGDIRTSAAPSYKLQLGSTVRIPFSLGPVVNIYWENTNEVVLLPNDSYEDKNTFYESFGFGIMGDIALVINPTKWFVITNGITAAWDFLKFERGEMASHIRQTKSINYQFTPYSAFVGSLYFGIGIRFE